MKVTIRNSVSGCDDISDNIKQFIFVKTKKKPPSFMPFEVQRVALTPKKVGLAQYKESFMSLVDKHQGSQPHYAKTTRRTERTPRTAASVHQTNRKRLIQQRNEQLLHSLYANECMGERRVKTAEIPGFRRRKPHLSDIIQQDSEQVQSFDVIDAERTLGPRLERRMRRTFDHLNFNDTSMTNRTFMSGSKRKSIVTVDGRQSLGFRHNPKSNHFQFLYADMSLGSMM